MTPGNGIWKFKKVVCVQINEIIYNFVKKYQIKLCISLYNSTRKNYNKNSSIHTFTPITAHYAYAYHISNGSNK